MVNIDTTIDKIVAWYEGGGQTLSPDEAKQTIKRLVLEAQIEELEYLKETGKWFTERGYYCFECNTLNHPNSYRNKSGILLIPYTCSNCGQGKVTHSSHVSLKQIENRINQLNEELKT